MFWQNGGFKCFLTEIIQDRVAGCLMTPRYSLVVTVVTIKYVTSPI